MPDQTIRQRIEQIAAWADAISTWHSGDASQLGAMTMNQADAIRVAADDTLTDLSARGYKWAEFSDADLVVLTAALHEGSNLSYEIAWEKARRSRLIPDPGSRGAT